MEKPYDYSRSRPLDQEKSKLSLAEIYEQEYIKQTQVRVKLSRIRRYPDPFNWKEAEADRGWQHSVMHAHLLQFTKCYQVCIITKDVYNKTIISMLLGPKGQNFLLLYVNSCDNHVTIVQSLW